MELSLIKTLMNKDFYDDHKGAKCPDRLFSKEVRKIKSTIDKAMYSMIEQLRLMRYRHCSCHLILA